MGCKRGCGTGTANIELIVKDIIRQQIEAGQLQEGLVDCEGGRLWREARIVTCDLLADAVCQLVEDGLLCINEIEAVVLDEGNHICILMSDGTKKCTTTSLSDKHVKDVKTDKDNKVTIEMADGKKFTIDIGKMLKTITATAVENDTGFVITGTDGQSVTIPKLSVIDKGDGTATLGMGDKQVDVVTSPTEVNTLNDGTVEITGTDGTKVSIAPVRKGDAGEDGIDGVDGKSAYQSWLDQGNTGTEHDFINSLKGDPGEKGAKGAKGDKGDKGDKGEAGTNANIADAVDNKTTFWVNDKIVAKRPDCKTYKTVGASTETGVPAPPVLAHINDLPIYPGFSCASISFGRGEDLKALLGVKLPFFDRVGELSFQVETVATGVSTTQTLYIRVLGEPSTVTKTAVYSRENSFGLVKSSDNSSPLSYHYGDAVTGANIGDWVEGEAPSDEFAGQWGKWAELTNVEMPAQSGGLDCAAIGALPVKEWKKGTTLLAKQGDECVQLSTVDSIFQEIGVALYATKLSGLTGDTYHVTATVTNSGEAPNTLTDLTLTKPQLGNYILSNFRTSVSSGARIEKLTDLTYKIHNLASGGTGKVEFDVVPNSGGTFQFGASVNPNTALDKQSNNNQATLTLSVQTPASEADVTVECPLVSAMWGDKPLLVNQLNQNDWDKYYYLNLGHRDSRANVFSTKDTLQGVDIKLTNVGSVQVIGSQDIDFDSPSVLSSGELVVNSYVSKKNYTAPPSDYTFNPVSGVLTITAPMKVAMVILHPRSEKCQKQYISLTTVYTPSDKYDLNTDVTPADIIKQTTLKGRLIESGTSNNLILDGGNIVGYIGAYGSASQVLIGTNITITVPKDGNLHSVTYVPKNGNTESKYFQGAFQQGNLSVTSNGNVLTFTANADALPTDSFKFKDVTLKVV